MQPIKIHNADHVALRQDFKDEKHLFVSSTFLTIWESDFLRGKEATLW